MLKNSKNPYYQFDIDIDDFEDRCKVDDPEGYQMIYHSEIAENAMQTLDSKDYIIGDEIENEMISEVVDNGTMSECEDDIDESDELKDEIDYVVNDPVRKYQFEYDNSLCMSNKYPEITA